MTALSVWAPAAQRVRARVWLEDAPVEVDLSRNGDWWSVEVPTATTGTDYGFLLDDDDTVLPDPRSMWQPGGVHAPSRLYDHAAFAWTDGIWRGSPLDGAVIYECHVGTFTPLGTFAGAVERLDHLVELGITHVELLPCNSFDGRWGWGYDGVDWFAVQQTYGGPDGLKAFVDACHAKGLGVIMDVVYNHLGPTGNYLGRFGPYLTDRHVTPWGSAVNLDAPGSDEVRRYILDNVAMWLRDYHCDGLRLDAVHALVDERATHLLEELAAEVASLAAQVRRPLFCIAESDLNDPRLITSREAGGYGLDGQWCDDVHHALWAALSGERQGYYVDFGTLETLGRALENAFVHSGTYSTFRGRRHGRPVDVDRTPGARFVTYLSDHDQVGNRAIGDRPSALLSPGLLHIGAALVALGPFTPMLFMGEEWGARTPWQFFSDHAGDLGEAVRRGRRAEFASHGWSGAQIPDPQDPATVRASTLDWSEQDNPECADLLDWHRKLFALRHSEADLADGRLDRVRCSFSDTGRWFVLQRGQVAVVCNLADARQQVPVDGSPIEALLASARGFGYSSGVVELDAESVMVVRLLPPV